MTIQLTKVALRAINGIVQVRAGRKLWVLEPNGPVTRTIDPGDVEATETLATVYADEDATVELEQPLLSEADGSFASAWVVVGSYDLFDPVDATNPIQRWEAVDASLTVGVIEGDIVAVAARTTSLESGNPINVARMAGADNAAKLTAAIAALPSTGAHLHIPRGKYDGSWTITGKAHLTVTGEGSSSVIHNATASPADALKFVDCDDLTVTNLRVQGTAGTRDGLHLENCQRASVGRIFCQGSGRHGIYAQRCFGLVVDPNAVGIDCQSPYPTGVTNCLTGLYLGWDGSDISSGCNQFVVNGGVYVVGKSQDTAIVIDHADGGLINGPIPELSKGGIRIVDSVSVQVNNYYGEANPSDVEYATGTCTVTNGSAAVSGAGTAWNTADGEGNINAYAGKWLIVGTSWARIQSTASDTALTLASVWPGTTAAGTAYRMQSVDVHLLRSHQCAIYSGRGGGAILLEASSRNLINTVTESIFFDATSNRNYGRVVTNRASGSANRVVDNGTGNRITQLNYQTGALVAGDPAVLDKNGQRFTQAQQFTQGAFTDPAPGVSCSIKADNNVAFDRIYGPEMPDPAAPPANIGVLYFKDVGGKTALMARFPTGAVQQIAIEP